MLILLLQQCDDFIKVPDAIAIPAFKRESRSASDERACCLTGSPAHKLHVGARAALRRPDGQHFDRSVLHAKVQPVPGDGHEVAPHFDRPFDVDSLAQARMAADDEEGLFQVQAHGAGGGGPMGRPLLGEALDLAPGARLDDVWENRHGYP